MAHQFSPAIDRYQVTVVQTAINATSSANAGMFSWVNPLNRAVYASVTVRLTTGGTGAYDVGVSDDGTGSASDFIATGTMAAGLYPAADLAIGGDSFRRIAANGAAGDSIVAKHNEDAGTSAGTIIVRYWPAS